MVLGYSQFGGSGEAAYMSYLRVTALSFLKDGLTTEGRALIAAADRVVGCDLGKTLASEVAGSGINGGVLRGEESGMEGGNNRKPCEESCPSFGGGEKGGSCGAAEAAVVSEGSIRGLNRVKGVDESGSSWLESSGNSGQGGLCFNCRGLGFCGEWVPLKAAVFDLHEDDEKKTTVVGCYKEPKKGYVVSDEGSDVEQKDGHIDGHVSISHSTRVDSSVVSGVDGESDNEKRDRNRQWRQARKERKKKRQEMNCDWREGRKRDASSFKKTPSCDSGASADKISLRASLEKKWQAQNELATVKARRELEVLKVSDIDQEVKRYRTKVSAATERNMVSIEKTHAFLRSTGNTPEERGGGFAETVVSGEPGLEGGSGTISPDSSASMAEFRNCQKALLDEKKKNEEYERIIKIATEKYGFPVERVDYMDKTVWTDTQSNRDILDDLYPDGYGMNTYTFDDGKFMPIRI